MREILFRGKRIDNGEWVEGQTRVVIHQDDNDLIFMPQQGEDVEADPMDGNDRALTSIYGNYYQILPQTVGQFTGLPDKSGTKIFEGDVVHVNYTLLYRESSSLIVQEKIIDYKAKVMFSKGRFHLKTFDGIEYELSGDSSVREVIGNIHDNPELLEAEK